MAVLRLKISKNEKEWIAIENAIMKKNTGKIQPQKGKGLNAFIASEINKRYHKKGDCNETTVGQRAMSFTINVSDEILAKIICEAGANSMRPASLISKLILDPLSLPPTE